MKKIPLSFAVTQGPVFLLSQQASPLDHVVNSTQTQSSSLHVMQLNSFIHLPWKTHGTPVSLAIGWQPWVEDTRNSWVSESFLPYILSSSLWLTKLCSHQSQKQTLTSTWPTASAGPWTSTWSLVAVQTIYINMASDGTVVQALKPGFLGAGWGRRGVLRGTGLYSTADFSSPQELCMLHLFWLHLLTHVS